MKKPVFMLSLVLLAALISCQLPDLTSISWITVNPQGGAAPAFMNNWANSGGATQPLAFGKDALGQVHIVGAITNSGPVGSTFLFTLSAGYVPAHDKYLSVIVSDGVNSGLGELRVYASNGNVQLFTYMGNIQYARFSDVSFTLN